MDLSSHQPPDWRVLIAILAGLASACGGEDTPVGDAPRNGDVTFGNVDVAPGDVLVFQGRESLQCGPKGLTPDQGAQVLISGGIDVVKSGCGAMTGVAFPAVCGGATGEILLHEIRQENLPDAERLGLQSTATLKNADGKGYAWVDCETGKRLP